MPVISFERSKVSACEPNALRQSYLKLNYMMFLPAFAPMCYKSSCKIGILIDNLELT